MDELAHDPARREELGGGGDVLRPDLLLFAVEPLEDVGLLLLVEVLVDPAQRFVALRRPRLCDLWGV